MWANPAGGDSSKVQERLVDVDSIAATSAAFAAVRRAGDVVTWGDVRAGGDCSAVQAELREVKGVASTDSAFAALLRNGSMITWGDQQCGGNSNQALLFKELFFQVRWPQGISIPSEDALGTNKTST